MKKRDSKNYGAEQKANKLFKKYLKQPPLILAESDFPYNVQDVIAKELAEEFESDRAEDIAFHLLDWYHDALFITALLFWPDQFSKEEISEGVYKMLPHAADHLAAASKLFGTPVTDTFEINALENDDDASK